MWERILIFACFSPAIAAHTIQVLMQLGRYRTCTHDVTETCCGASNNDTNCRMIPDGVSKKRKKEDDLVSLNTCFRLVTGDLLYCWWIVLCHLKVLITTINNFEEYTGKSDAITITLLSLCDYFLIPIHKADVILHVEHVSLVCANHRGTCEHSCVAVTADCRADALYLSLTYIPRLRIIRQMCCYISSCVKGFYFSY